MTNPPQAAPVDVKALQALCDVPRPTPMYQTGSGNFTPEFERKWDRFAKARRDMANAVPQLLAELTTARQELAAATARAEQAEAERRKWRDFCEVASECERIAETERDAYRATLEQIAGYPVGADWSAGETMQRMAAKALAALGSERTEEGNQ